MDEFDELEIETIAAAHYYDDEDHCLDEDDDINEYGSICGTDSARRGHYHRHASGSGCLIIVLTGVVIAICAGTLLILAV